MCRNIQSLKSLTMGYSNHIFIITMNEIGTKGTAHQFLFRISVKCHRLTVRKLNHSVLHNQMASLAFSTTSRYFSSETLSASSARLRSDVAVYAPISGKITIFVENRNTARLKNYLSTIFT